jgi:glutamate dehydrogenase (NAD(P)+)
MVGVADISGALHDPHGIDVAALMEHANGGGEVRAFANGSLIDRDEAIAIPCDILIPAARPDVITMENVACVDTKLIIQGANIPIAFDAEDELHRRGVLSVPDFIANAGGLICGAVELKHGTKDQALALIEEKIRENTEIVLANASEQGITPRAAAVALAETRVRAAMATRRF